MKLQSLLIKKRSVILQEWIETAYKAYPPDTVKILNKKKDQFQNPIGFSISESLSDIYDIFAKKFDSQKVASSLEKVIKLRSVQDISPSNSVSFIFNLKDIIRQTLNTEINENQLHRELADFEKLIDQTALLAFESFTDCREKLNELKLKQAKNGPLKIVDRLNKRLQNETNASEQD